MRTTREILFIIIVLFPMALIGQTTYYVSNSGNDSTEGTNANNPWQTLNKVNQTSFKPGDKILFNRGDSWEGTINVKSSGSNGNPITYGAYGTGEKPKIYGSSQIRGWTLYSGNIYKATVGSAVAQLFVDGEKIQVSRMPNTSYYYPTSIGSATQFTSTSLNGGIDYTGTTCLYRGLAYILSQPTVTSSSSQTINLSAAPTGGLSTSKGFVLMNSVNLIDQAGEWAYDSGTNTVYVWLPDSSNPSTHVITGSTMDYCIRVDYQSYLVFENLDTRNAAIDGIHPDNCHYVTVNNCDASNCGVNGIVLGGGSHYTVTNNTINNCGNSGIKNYSDYSLISKNTVTNIALFNQIGLPSTGECSAITTVGRNCDVTYNTIENVGYCGITTWYAEDNLWKYNFIKNTCTVLDDGGAIYGYTGDYSLPGMQGSEISYNIIIDTYGNKDGYGGGYNAGIGIYMDAGIHDVVIDNNTIYGSTTGIQLNNHNGLNTVTNNTLMNFGMGLIATLNQDVDKCSVTNNIFYTTNTLYDYIWWSNSNQRLVRFSGASPIFDYNTYISHYNNTTLFYPDNSMWYSLAGWQTVTTEGKNSTIDTSPLAKGEIEELFYNATKKDKRIDLKNTIYRNLDGKEVSGSITLKPFTSIILIKTTSQSKTNTSPSISDQSFNIDEVKSTGDFIGQVSATDSDANQTLAFSIVGGNDDNLFTIDSSNGTITANTEISLTSDQTFVLTVQVVDDASSPLASSAEITINVKSTATVPTSDTTLPVITSFNVASTATSLAIPINSFTATDNGTIKGYLLTTSSETPSAEDNNWTSSAPTSYTFKQDGTQIIYAWVIDANGNISDASSATVKITLPELSPVFSEYLFEEKAGDVALDSQGSNDGSIVNEEIRAPGILGSGLEFNSNGYIHLGQSFSDNVQNELTLSVWLKPSQNSSGYQGIIMHGGPETDNFALYLNPNSKTIAFKTSGTTSAWTPIDNVSSLWDGEWHHLAVTYDGASKIIYLDNQPLLKVDATGMIDSGEGYNLYIGAGRDEASPTLLYQGQIDEVRIYNYALTSSEIAALYNIAKEEESVVEENSAPSISNQTFIVDGGMSINDIIGQVVASDSDSGQTISFSIASGNLDNLFAIDSSTGEIFVTKTFAPDADQTVALTILVTDNAASPLSSNAKVTIEIKKAVEINQSPVVYDQAFEVEGNFEINDLIGQIIASDPNRGQKLTYSIVNGNSDGLFTVNQTSGEILASYDFITTTPIQSSFVVEIKDDAEQLLSSQATITINITALQLNHSPIISDQVFEMPTDISVNNLIGRIIASDPDVQQTLSFGIIQGNEDNLFRIDAATGELYLNSIIPASTDGTMSIVIEVKDNAETPLSAYATILLTQNKIIEINNRPVAENVLLEIEENTPLSTTIGQVIASDSDIDQTLSYQIIQGNEAGMFSINPSNGELVVSSALGAQTYTLIVRVKDNAPEPLATDVYVTITVLPKEVEDNENRPAIGSNQTPVILNQHFEIRKNDWIGDVVGQVIASDPDLDQTLTYAIIQGNEEGFFNIDPSTGEIYLATAISQPSEQDVSLVVEVTDNAESPRSANASVTINILINGKIVKGEINNNNHKRIILYFDESLQSDNLKSSQIKSDFVLSHNKIVQQISIDGNEIHLDIDSEYQCDDEIIVSYSKGATRIYNESGNEIDSFDDYVIDNNIQDAGINTGIEPDLKSLDVTVYPNPTNGIFHIKGANLSGDDCEVTLYSMTGTTVSKKILSASFGNLEESVNVSNLKKGTYILHFVCERQVYKDKLVIM